MNIAADSLPPPDPVLAPEDAELVAGAQKLCRTDGPTIDYVGIAFMHDQVVKIDFRPDGSRRLGHRPRALMSNPHCRVRPVSPRPDETGGFILVVSEQGRGVLFEAYAGSFRGRVAGAA